MVPVFGAKQFPRKYDFDVGRHRFAFPYRRLRDYDSLNINPVYYLSIGDVTYPLFSKRQIWIMTMPIAQS
jgi:hypothetical protein